MTGKLFPEFDAEKAVIHPDHIERLEVGAALLCSDVEYAWFEDAGRRAGMDMKWRKLANGEWLGERLS